MSRAAAFAVFALLASCQRGPRYCDQNLSGVWVNSNDPSYAYRLEDKGDSVRGKFFRRAPDGGEAPADPDDTPMLIELRRSEGALSGAMKTKGQTPGGRICDFEFALRVSSCQPQALQVVGETSYDVREDCTRQGQEDGGETSPRLVEYRWERAAAADAR